MAQTVTPSTEWLRKSRIREIENEGKPHNERHPYPWPDYIASIKPGSLHIHDSSDSIRAELGRYSYVGSPEIKRLQFDANLTAMRAVDGMDRRGPLTTSIPYRAAYKFVPMSLKIRRRFNTWREAVALWLAPWLEQD